MTNTVEPMTESSKYPQVIRSLRHKNFRLYFSGQVISQVGTWMQIVAQGWVVYNLTNSPLMLGLVNFAALLPVVPVSLLAGVLSDRFSRRNIIIISESILLLQAMIMAGLIWFNMIQVWHVIALSFVLGASSAIEQPARLAFIVDVVGRDDLSNAIALNSSGNNLARIAGPALAGIIVASIGAAACFLINGISYLAVIIALMVIQLPHRTFSNEPLQVVGSLKNGFSHIMNSKIIMSLLLITSVASFLTIPYIALMPVFARDQLNTGAEGLGFLLASIGIGAILGALLVANLKKGKRGEWLVISNILGPIFLILFCISTSLPLSLLLVGLVGASNSMRLTLANSLTQLNTAEEYQGRVMSVFNLLFNSMSRVGALAIGGLAEIVSLSWALGASSFLSAVIGLIFIFKMPKLRSLE